MAIEFDCIQTVIESIDYKIKPCFLSQTIIDSNWNQPVISPHFIQLFSGDWTVCRYCDMTDVNIAFLIQCLMLIEYDFS